MWLSICSHGACCPSTPDLDFVSRLQAVDNYKPSGPVPATTSRPECVCLVPRVPNTEKVLIRVFHFLLPDLAVRGPSLSRREDR